MIQVIVKTNGPERRITTEVTSTPKATLEELGIVTNNAIYLNGMTLNRAQMEQSFQNLGIEDGTNVHLNSLVKADGGRV